MLNAVSRNGHRPNKLRYFEIGAGAFSVRYSASSIRINQYTNNHSVFLVISGLKTHPQYAKLFVSHKKN